MKIKFQLIAASLGLGLTLSGCASKKIDPSDSAHLSAPRAGEIGSSESSMGKAPIETEIPALTERRIRADINRMSAQDFTQIGMNPESAQKVIEYRTEHGNFKSVDELKNVPGMDSAWVTTMHDRLAAG